MMSATSIIRIAAPYLALVAVCGAATVVGITHVWREPPVETRAVTATPTVVPPVSGGSGEGPAALATVKNEANTLAAALATLPALPDADPSVPVFDVARIERSGDAVIAGRAAPGATVELLRNGERHDRVVADRSGQFVMVPSRLPAGEYELTLRSTQPDGKQVTSKQSVVVALAAAEPNAGAVRSRAETPNVRESVAAGRAVLDQAVASSQAIEPSDGGSPSAEVAPKVSDKTSTKTVTKTATMTVSRGDSLWRISHLTYGEGIRYAVLYKANRDLIRNPDRIYPGQVFVLPAKAR
ncbi:MAG: Nucleoid-associated protein YgaU, contains and LysM domain [Tardiphaga sp.]|nr:Nucleoid-associated protein YgaU, contains and LysM domain [Tardiphaga sp.]